MTAKFHDRARKRSTWIRKLLGYLRTNEDWTVRRGAVHWPSWRWPKDFVCEVRAVENFPQDEMGICQTILQISIMTNQGQDGEMDDDLLEDLELKIFTAAAALAQEVVDGSNVITRIDHRSTVEMSDDDNTLQGWLITFAVDF